MEPLFLVGDRVFLSFWMAILRRRGDKSLGYEEAAFGREQRRLQPQRPHKPSSPPDALNSVGPAGMGIPVLAPALSHITGLGGLLGIWVT